jgi:hypothetical protein
MPSTSVRPDGPRLTRFILTDKTVTRRFLYKIPRAYREEGKLAHGRDAAYAKLYPQLIAANDGKDKVFFRAPVNLADPNKKMPVVFNTTSAVLARWLRNEIREKRLRAREDVTTMPARCPWCEFETPGSTDADRIAMYEHHLDAHPDKLNETDAPPRDENAA